jgi:hypothetical protein
MAFAPFRGNSIGLVGIEPNPSKSNQIKPPKQWRTSESVNSDLPKTAKDEISHVERGED